MLSALVKARIASLFSSFFRSRRSKQPRSPLMKVLVAVLAIYIMASMLFSFGALFQAILDPLQMAGLDWLYFSLVSLLAFGVIFISSLFMTQAQLYEAKDNEMLLAMPIPPRLILVSRLIMLLVMDYFLEFFIIAPAAVVYWLHTPLTPTGLFYFIAAFLFLPLLTLALASLMGWILAIISSRLRNKSLVISILSIALLLGYMFAVTQLNRYMEYLVRNGAAIGEAIQRSFLPAYLLGKAVAEHSLPNLLGFIALALVLFLAVYFVLAANFLRIVTTKSGTAKIAYKERPLKASGAMSALVRKELKLFFSKPMYIMNAALGVIFTFILPVAIYLKRDILLSMFGTDIPGIAGMTAPFTVVILCFLAATNFISAPSISLEGKNLWIPQSSPVSGGDVLLAKAYAHMVVCLPAVVFAALVLALIPDFSPAIKLLLLATPAAMTVFQALFGVAVNLRFPKFDWINETVAIKQSMSTLVVMFGSMGIVAGGAALYGFVLMNTMSVELYITLFTALLAAGSAGLFGYLKTKGGEAFGDLQA